MSELPRKQSAACAPRHGTVASYRSRRLEKQSSASHKQEVFELLHACSTVHTLAFDCTPLIKMTSQSRFIHVNYGPRISPFRLVKTGLSGLPYCAPGKRPRRRARALTAPKDTDHVLTARTSLSRQLAFTLETPVQALTSLSRPRASRPSIRTLRQVISKPFQYLLTQVTPASVQASRSISFRVVLLVLGRERTCISWASRIPDLTPVKFCLKTFSPLLGTCFFRAMTSVKLFSAVALIHRLHCQVPTHSSRRHAEDSHEQLHCNHDTMEYHCLPRLDPVTKAYNRHGL